MELQLSPLRRRSEAIAPRLELELSPVRRRSEVLRAPCETLPEKRAPWKARESWPDTIS